MLKPSKISESHVLDRIRKDPESTHKLIIRLFNRIQFEKILNCIYGTQVNFLYYLKFVRERKAIPASQPDDFFNQHLNYVGKFSNSTPPSFAKEQYFRFLQANDLIKINEESRTNIACEITDFGIELAKRFEKKRTKSGNVYRGIKIKDGSRNLRSISC